MRHLLPFIVFGLLAASASAAKPPHAPVQSAVVNLAPDFAISGVPGKARTLRSLRGQSVVLLLAKSVKTSALKKEVKYLQELYEQFASKETIFAVAFREGDDLIPSNIPFVIVSNGPAVNAAYGVQKDFSIAIIGKDGNLDYITTKVLPPERVRDVIQNSFPVQDALRKKDR